MVPARLTGRVMTEAAAQRRLAAILAADVVGYSRLMATAEAATLARLKAHRAELIDPLLAAHGGRLIKLMGDGALVEFPSVVEAVACAIDIQRGMAERDADRTEDERIRFRIGINLGDVLIDGDDLYGDGVNIAARLEHLAEPGGIVLSAAAFDQVTGKLPVAFRDLGERRLKNIARPVRVYALEASAGAPAAGARWLRRNWRALVAAALLTTSAGVGSAVWLLNWHQAPDGAAPQVPLAERPAIAVLPFTNLADPTDGYFSDGLTEDIASALAKFGDLAVIDPKASFAEGRGGDLATITRQLGARYVVRGTVRRDGARVRVSAQLVEGSTGALRWSQSYDVSQTDVFAVQDDSTRQLAGTLAVRLDQLEQIRIATKPPDSLEVYDLVLRGRRLTSEATRAGNREARRILAAAVARDPNYAPAWAALGQALIEQSFNGWTEFPDDARAEAEKAAHAALALDPSLAGAHGLLGNIFLTRKQFDLALAELDLALAANPSDAQSYERRGDVLMWSGDQPAAIASLEAAQRLNPTGIYGNLGMSYYLIGRYRDAVSVLTRSLAGESGPMFRTTALAILAASYAQLGDSDGAARTRAELASVAPFFDTELFVSQFGSERDRARLSDGLAKAGIAG
jgi:adenylate cyclase